MIDTPSERANGTCWSLREELARKSASSGSSICAEANSRKSTTGGEVSVWRALVLRRERASAAALADPCMRRRSVVN